MRARPAFQQKVSRRISTWGVSPADQAGAKHHRAPLSDDGGPGRTGHTPAQHGHEQRIQQDVGYRPDAGDAHAQHRPPRNADEITEHLGQPLQQAAQRHNAVIGQGIVVGRFGHAEHPQQRVGKSLQKRRQRQFRHGHQHQRIAKGSVHLLLFATPRKQAEQRRTAGAAGQTKGHHHVREGKTDGQSRQRRSAVAVAHKDAVHNVVDGGDQQRNGRRDGILQNHREQFSLGKCVDRLHRIVLSNT